MQMVDIVDTELAKRQTCVFAKLVGMTQGSCCFITRDNRQVLKRSNGGGARMTQAVMPQGGRDKEAATSGDGW